MFLFKHLNQGNNTTWVMLEISLKTVVVPSLLRLDNKSSRCNREKSSSERAHL